LTAESYAGEVIVYGSVKRMSWEREDRELRGRFGERIFGRRRKSSSKTEHTFKGSIEIEKSAEKEATERLLADGGCADGGGRGAEEYLITKECLGSYTQGRDQ